MQKSLRLNIATKLAVVTIALIFPIITLLYLLVSEKNIAINFGTKEYYGDQYLKPLRKVLEQLPYHRVLVHRSRVLGERTPFEGQQAAIDSALKELESVEAQYGAGKGFAETGTRITQLKTSWENLKTQSSSAPVAQVLKNHDEAVAQLRALITYVGDYSNLILDPDLDSYYLMDVTLLRVPSMMDSFYQLQQLSEAALDKGQVSADEKTQLTVLSGLIKSHVEGLRYDHDTTYANTKDTSLKGKLEPNVASSQKSLKAFLDYIERNILNTPEVRGNLQSFASVALTAAQQTFAMYDTSLQGEDKLLMDRVNRFENNRNFTITWVTLLTLLFLAIGAYIILGIIQGISQLKRAAQAVRSGNLDMEVHLNSGDELGELSEDFNAMINSIRTSTRQLEESASLIEEDKSRLQVVVEEITNEISIIRQNAEIVTDNARIVSETATAASSVSEEGEQVVQGSIDGVERIKHQIETVAAKILELSAQTQAIGEIIATVDEISRQSKFLAFNASIEASKVGEYGKGFAIVANEIKNLSEESKEATKKISDILNEIQGLTNTSVMLAEDATKLADAGYQLSTNAGETINKLTFSIQNSAEAAYQITSSAMEQQSSLEQLANALQKTLATSSR